MCLMTDHRASPKGERSSPSASATSATSAPSSTANAACSTSAPICSAWTYVTEGLLHPLIRKGVVTLSGHAARHPYSYLITITVLSLSLIATGFFTNFRMVYNQEEIFTPIGSLPAQHSHWLRYESGFEPLRPFLVLLHQRGSNVLSVDNVRYLFEALETVQGTPGYQSVCQSSSSKSYSNSFGQGQPPTCRVSSATQFWNNQRTDFEKAMAQLPTQQEDPQTYLLKTLSNDTFPDGTPVFHEAILGNYQQINTTTGMVVQTNPASELDINLASVALQTTTNQPSTSSYSNNITNRENQSQQQQQQPQLQIHSAQSFVLKIDIPDLGKETDALEKRILSRLGDLRKAWDANVTINSNSQNHHVQLEYFTMYAYQLEFERTVYSDIPLVFVMLAIMVGFCCAVFYDPNDRIQSRSLMGLFSICTVGMSLLTGYGLVWIMGVPFTSIVMMVPFIVVGVGLDDTFIITGEYFRKSRQLQRQLQQNTTTTTTTVSHDDIVKRVEETMDEVGLSITLTTITTVVAFCLGSLSSIPAIRWLCIYGFVTIGVDFIYQITYFVAWLVVDERRVQAKRKDCCVWVVVDGEGEEEENRHNAEIENLDRGENEDNVICSEDETSKDTQDDRNEMKSERIKSKRWSERLMTWYADQLLKPIVKAIVLIAFAVYLGGCVYSTTQMTQEFRIQDYVPKGSYVTSFFSTFEEYSTLFRQIGVYFRDVNQSDVMVQQQMLEYVDELSHLEEIGGPPEFFWLRDFAKMAQSPDYEQLANDLNLANKTFNEQIDLVLQIPQIKEGYGGDIVRDDAGTIVASRCFIFLRKIDMDSIPNQIDMLMDQRTISKRQPVNQGKHSWPFFTFDDLYFYWELYAVSVHELVITTIEGVCAVSAIAFLLIPHWTSVLFVTPLIMCLYFLLLGTMQYCGIHVNVITYVIVVMAIGLLVDFLMHIMLRYYETTGATRYAKVKETLETMGASILLGGLTTFLGVIPLAFSTTKIFMTVFISFFAMVILGCVVGLIVLPVLLSMFGPLVSIQHNASKALLKQRGDVLSESRPSSTTQDETREQSDVSTSDGEYSGELMQSLSPPLHVVMSAPEGDAYETDIEV